MQKAGLAQYLAWQDTVQEICQIGDRVSWIVKEQFPTLDREAAIIPFLQSGRYQVLNQELTNFLKKREEFWFSRSVKQLRFKLFSELALQRHHFNQGVVLGKKEDIFLVFIWLYSSLDIIKRASGLGILSQQENDQLIDGFNALVVEGIQYFQSSRPDKTQDILQYNIHHQIKLESNAEYLKRYSAKNIKNIFRVGLQRDSNLVEIVERWDFDKRRISVCVPISIGCPARCLECHIGMLLSYRRTLTGDEIIKLICDNSVINDDLTSLCFEPFELTTYYLGGGDPAYNIPAIEKAVKYVHELCYGSQRTPFIKQIIGNHEHRSLDAKPLYPFRQVVSTLGINNGSVEQLIDLACIVPELGIQISVNAFNEDVRAFTLKHTSKILSLEDCISLAKLFYEKTGQAGHARKMYLSSFLFHDNYDRPDQILRDLQKLKVDRETCHITLTVLRDPPPSFIHKVATLEQYKAVETALKDDGYEVSIYSPVEDIETEEGCGVVSRYSREATAR